MDGRVSVTWREEEILPVSEADYRRDLRAQLPVYAVAFAVAALVAAAIVLVTFLGVG